jgi:protocatechuate 3,4-dioxygenase, beta subunit
MAVATYEDANPPYLYPAYEATLRRAPTKRLIEVPKGFFHHSTGPVWGRVPVRPGDNDLTKQHAGRPIGQTIMLRGRVLDSDGRGVPNTLIEIWQTNASGAYADPADPGFMSLDPNFTGAGRTITDSEGRYHFRTIKPASYPGALGSWHRPAHIHTSLFGPLLGSRLVTQCYFQGEPLLAHDSIFQAIPDQRASELLVARFNIDDTEPGDVDAALAYDWDIVLRGPAATPMENR